MNKKRVFFFSGVAAFALLGIVITQLFWVKDALELRREQFNQRAMVSLNSESTQMLDAQIDSSAKYLFHEMTLPIILSLLFLIILSLSFYMIIRLMFRQKRMSQIKTDFINNMTHEFKTPIATISLASEMLLQPDINKFPYKTKRYATIIFDENHRLQQQVEQVLQLSVLERGNFKLKLKDLDLHRIIRLMADHFSVNAQKKGGMIFTDLKATKYQLSADKTHLSNIISNLIDNALKYTPEAPERT